MGGSFELTAKDLISQLLEHPMIPLLAAASTIDTVDKLATGAVALWKQLSAKNTEANEAGGASSGSFSSALASQSIMGRDALASAASSVDAAFSHAKAGKAGHAVDHLA